MEKSGEKLHKSFCQNGLLARQADKEVLGRFAEQTLFQRKVVKDIHCSVLKDQTFKLNRNTQNIFGDDALRGHTRSHSEHDG